MKILDFKKVHFYEGIRAEEDTVPVWRWERDLRNTTACLWAGPQPLC